MTEGSCTAQTTQHRTLAGHDEILASESKPGLRISSLKLPGKTESDQPGETETVTEPGH